MALLSVSAYAADPVNFESDMILAKSYGADYIHVDVMDGRFVPSIGLNFESLQSIQNIIDLPIDIHLMTVDNKNAIDRFSKYMINSIIFHHDAQSYKETFDLLLEIQKYQIKCGLAISPDTDLGAIVPYIPHVSEILIMTSQPGLAGAEFLESSYFRVRSIKQLCENSKSEVTLTVDGGISEQTVEACIKNGAGKVVMGRGFFSNPHVNNLVAKIHTLNQV